MRIGSREGRGEKKRTLDSRDGNLPVRVNDFEVTLVHEGLNMHLDVVN
jgi:hypothetical protein